MTCSPADDSHIVLMAFIITTTVFFCGQPGNSWQKATGSGLLKGARAVVALDDFTEKKSWLK